MATLWRYLPGFPAPPPWVEMLPPRAGPTAITLSRPGLDGVRLAVMPTAAGDGWWTVEYRPATEWDVGFTFDSSDTTNSPGLVVYRLRDVGAASDGPPFPLFKRVTYEATIPLPSAGDNDWDNGQFAVRILQESPASVRVMIGETLPDAASARLNVVAGPGPETSTPNVEVVNLVLTGPTCSSGSFNTRTISNDYSILLEVASTGFINPGFEFTVNGVAFGSKSQLGAPPQIGTGAIVATITEPTGYNQAHVVTRVVTLQWGIEDNKFQLLLPSGDGAYQLSVEATVTEEAPGAPPRQAVAKDTVKVETTRITLSEAGSDAESQCLSFLIDKGLQHQPLFPLDPIGPVIFPDDWGGLDPVELAVQARKLLRLKALNSALAAQPTASAAEQLGIQPQDLFNVVRMLTIVPEPG
jgi:hypothetical protein